MKLIFYRFLILVSSYFCMIDPFQNVYLLTFLMIILILSFVKLDLKSNSINILIAFIFVFSIYVFGQNFNYRTTSLGAYFLLFIYLSTASLRQHVDHKALLKINTIGIFKNFIIVIATINIILLIIYPGATSYLNNTEVFDFYNFPRWLYYFLINTTAHFAIVLFTILYLKYKKNSLSSILLFFLVLILQLLSSKTTAFSILLISSLLIFRKQNIFISFFYILIGAIIINVFITEYIYTRLNFYNLSSTSEELSRFFLGQKSLNTFFDNPLFGIGYERVKFSSISELFYTSEIGHHSYLLDTLGRFGIIGFCLFYILDVKNWRLLSGVPLVMIIVYSILNNLIDFSFIFFSLIFFKLFNKINEKDSSLTS